MYDINKYLSAPKASRSDPYGHFHDLAHWSPRVATEIAAREGIELEEDHWAVIYCLRETYRMLGPEWTARDLTRRLEKEFADAGGKRRLYELFPRGPLMQGCRIAGLPLPHGTTSSSFGSVH